MASTFRNGKVLLAPLDWGLGHATRCIPIARALMENGFEPVLAGSGDSLKLMRKELPDLRHYDLPGYEIRYSKDPRLFKWKLFMDSPRLIRTIDRERREVEQIIHLEKPVGIISDSRFGVRSDRVPSIYITHQLTVLAGGLTSTANRWHRSLIKKFHHCWVCDHKDKNALAGRLSSPVRELKNVTWIGPLSRFSSYISEDKEEEKEGIDVLVLLSGPEPSRSIFEKRILDELSDLDKNIVMIRGQISKNKRVYSHGTIEVHDYVLQDELRGLIDRSKLVVARSGYSTVMDLEQLGSKALLVPTPGQTEQEYLAEFLNGIGVCLSTAESRFSIDLLEQALEYQGFRSKNTSNEGLWKSLFEVFS